MGFQDYLFNICMGSLLMIFNYFDINFFYLDELKKNCIKVLILCKIYNIICESWIQVVEWEIIICIELYVKLLCIIKF